jgi:hypothetical protein
MSRWTILSLVLLLLSAEASAQRIRGVVRDAATGEPIEGAVLTAIGPDSVVRGAGLSEPDGSFRLDLPTLAGLQLRAQHPGYATQRSMLITLGRGDTLRLEVGMRAEAVALEGVTVRAVANQNLRRFLRRKSTGFGSYMGPEQIATIPTKSSTHILLGMPGSPLMLGANGRTLMMRTRGATPTTSGAPCAPSIYVDGYSITGEREMRRWGGQGRSSNVATGVALESFVPTGAIRAVEVYHNPAQAPGDYQRPFMECGVVLIWTDYGFGFGTP